MHETEVQLQLLLAEIAAYLSDNSMQYNVWADVRQLECRVKQYAEMLGLKKKKSVRRHIKPLIEQGRLAMTLPDRPNSKNQKYITIK